MARSAEKGLGFRAKSIDSGRYKIIYSVVYLDCVEKYNHFSLRGFRVMKR